MATRKQLPIVDDESEIPEYEYETNGDATPEESESPLPAKKTQSRTFPVEGGVPFTTRINKQDWEVLRMLQKHYGVDRASDALRLSMYDALAHVETSVGTEAGEAAQADNTAVVERLDRLIELMELPPEEEETGAEEEAEVEEGPYDSESIAAFEKLDSQGKKYLATRLTESTRIRRAGNSPSWQKDINVHISKLCPAASKSGGTLSDYKKERNELLAYLQEEGILPKSR